MRAAKRAKPSEGLDERRLVRFEIGRRSEPVLATKAQAST